jgi:15-cis-phytoene synthase
MPQASSDEMRVITQEDRTDLRHCRTLLKNGSRSFYAASFLLPASVRDPAIALYAFCRLADDAVDDGDGQPAVIQALHQKLDDIYAGQSLSHPVDRAFAHVVLQFGLPRQAMDALIEGFAWDLSDRRYKTLSDVLDYSARVAGCVGIMMTTLMHARHAAVLARAADLGVAMQLSNIARDVGEDARNGRLYLPTDWLLEAGIDPDQFMAQPEFTPALGKVIERLLNEADRLYLRADAGITMLPSNCRLGIRAARLIYAAIGDAVRKNGYDSVSRRAFVPTSEKLRLMSTTVLAPQIAPELKTLPPLSATSFLVDAVLITNAIAPQASDVPWWNMVERFMPVLRIFEKLKRHDREILGRAIARSG